MASPEEQEHARRMLKKLRARLRQRELQVADLGITADPLIVNEIDDLKASIADIEQHHAQAPFVVEARQVARNQYGSDIEFLIADGGARNRRQTKLEKTQSSMAVELHELTKTVLSIAGQVADSEHARRVSAPQYRRLFLIGLCMSILALMVSCAALFGG